MQLTLNARKKPVTIEAFTQEFPPPTPILAQAKNCLILLPQRTDIGILGSGTGVGGGVFWVNEKDGSD